MGLGHRFRSQQEREQSMERRVVISHYLAMDSCLFIILHYLMLVCFVLLPVAASTKYPGSFGQV